MSYLLSISIPTYNRGALVTAQVQRLLPQLTQDCCIHIFDNASTDDTVESLLALGDKRIQISKSPVNIGMAGNICRALIESEAEWIWVLGDDDTVHPDAVARALDFCEKAESGVVEFDSMGGEILQNRVLNGLKELYEDHDPIRSLFISSHIFHRRSVLPYMSVLVPSSFTFGPHTALILKMLEGGNAPLTLFKDSLLIPEQTIKGWSSLEVALGISLLPEFISDVYFQKIAARRLKIDVGWMLCFGFREVVDHQSAKRWRKTVKQVSGNLSAYGAGWLPLGDNNRRPTKKEIADFILVTVAYWLPSFVMQKLGERLRKKYLHDRGLALKDL